MTSASYEVRADLSVAITAEGGRVVQPSTGKALVVSADEAWVLQTLQGAGGIVAAVIELGQRQNPPLPAAKVEAVVQRMAELTILVKKAPSEGGPRLPTPSAPPAAAPLIPRPSAPLPSGGSGTWAQLDPAEVLPAFRADLKLRKKGKGLFDVVDESAGKHFTVYDFEVSLARLMNGRRTAAEIVENGSRLGIPVTLETLKKFVRQLTAYGFLVAVPDAAAPMLDAPGAEGGAWEAREEWDPGVRQLFQSGIRLLNQGRTADAKGYFEALVELDPQHVEALEQLSLLNESKAADAPVADDVPADRPSADSRRVWLAVGAAMATSIAGMAVGLVVLWRTGPTGESAAPVSAPVSTPAPPQATDAGRAEVPQVPPPADWTAPGVATHPETGPVMAPAKGALHWLLAAGATVERGAVVATIQSASASTTRAIARTKRKVAELEALAKADPIYRDFVVRERAKLKRLERAKGKEVRVLAPAAGTLQPGPDSDEVEVGARLGLVVDATRWVVTADGATPPPVTTARCSVEGASAGQSAPCTVAGRDGVRLVVEVNAADAPWLDGQRTARVRLAP